MHVAVCMFQCIKGGVGKLAKLNGKEAAWVTIYIQYRKKMS